MVLRLGWRLFCLSRAIASLINNTAAVLHRLRRGSNTTIDDGGGFWLVLRRLWRSGGFVDLGHGCAISLLVVVRLPGHLLLLFLTSV